MKKKTTKEKAMIVYKTTNLINNKIYIGRELNQSKSYLGSGIILKQAIKKYGRENFKKDILQICFSVEELNKAEIFWIDKLNSRNNKIGYNMAIGGTGGAVLGTVWNKGKKGLQKHTDEWKQANSERMKIWYKSHDSAMKGKHPWNYGIPCTEEHKRKQSEKMKNIKYLKEECPFCHRVLVLHLHKCKEKVK